MRLMHITQLIKRKAIALGFDAVGVTSAEAISAQDRERLSAWLGAGYAGQMTYMARHFDKRVHPAKLLEGARSVVVVGLNYTSPTANSPKPGQGKVAAYARYDDYHPFMKRRLYALAEYMVAEASRGGRFKVCVDSAPVAERALAVRAGLGFIGRNHMLIRPGMGCRVLLGEILTTLELAPDKPGIGNCGGCAKCIDVCPTGALGADGSFDSRRCINYLTIEHKGEIEPQLAVQMQNSLFGCERCISVCPYQQGVSTCDNNEFRYHPERESLDCRAIQNLSEAAFREMFADSPILRPGLDSLKRNAQICLRNMQGRAETC